ncbi:gut esterase 1 [Aplysia californica]|uniref:Carboxylic ester hydrolase n=1 Tax=Aplysia californica TaxID=6500 RepID=A0ABM1VST2_APLCA|nr:gut esterase 1 [Aplysia californica]
MLRLVALTLCLCHVTLTVQAISLVRVTSPTSSYVGQAVTTEDGRSFHAFRGVPYAEPPVGDLRFRKPVAKPPLDGEYQALGFKPYCIQMNYMPSSFGAGQEDCLYLNVFTPGLRSSGQSSELLKVLFFIHGGGNLNGFADFYMPGSLVTHNDVIVVTINYRLGLLGFLSTNSSASLGNYGLWDQVLALKWVKNNIRAFGGDPEAITVSGESAGAIDTSVLTLCSQARGLFARAFSMSGATGVDHPMVLAREPVTMAELAARREQCLGETDPVPETDEQWAPVVECLRKVPEDRFGSMAGLGEMPLIGPVVDGDLVPNDIKNLFSDQAYLERIGFHDKQYLVSVVHNEGSIFETMLDDMRSSMTEEQLASIPPDALFYGLISELLKSGYGQVSPEVVAKVAEYYQENFEVSPVADFSADSFFIIPSLEYINAASGSANQSKAWLLRFVNFAEFMTEKNKGMCHVMDLFYLFDIDINEIKKWVDFKIDSSKWSQEDTDLKAKYGQLVSSFVKTGKPEVPKEASGKEPPTWPPYDPVKGQYLAFSSAPSLAQHLKADRLRLFQQQIPEWIQEFPLQPPSKEEL